MNHVAHSDASKSAKAAEANLKNKIEDLQLQNDKLESESRRCVIPWIYTLCTLLMRFRLCLDM